MPLERDITVTRSRLIPFRARPVCMALLQAPHVPECIQALQDKSVIIGAVTSLLLFGKPHVHGSISVTVWCREYYLTFQRCEVCAPAELQSSCVLTGVLRKDRHLQSF